MIGQMAIAIALPGFNNLGRSVTPIFLSLDHFLYRFSTFGEKLDSIRSFSYLQNASNSVLFSFSFICATLSNASRELSFVKTLVTFGIIYATDPLLQNMTEIVRFR